MSSQLSNGIAAEAATAALHLPPSNVTPTSATATLGPSLPLLQSQRQRRRYTMINCSTVEFALPADYTFMEYLGAGMYGNVIKVKHFPSHSASSSAGPNSSSSSSNNGDHQHQLGAAMESAPVVDGVGEGMELAVKKMYEPFNNSVKAKRVYRELKLLQMINHENIIRFVEIYSPDPDLRRFRNIYIVTAYAGVSLKQVLDEQKRTGSRLLQFEHVKYIVYQLLRALKYLHSANVIHRDLKPSNLSITEDCDLTVLDFGLARTVSNTTDNLTAYVISRWYRSPEVIYWNNVSYNAKADVWSVGCILAELLTGRVLFPGSEAMEQYKLIIRLCGSPDEELIRKIEAITSPAMRMVIQRLGEGCQRYDFHQVFTNCPREAVSLLDRLLVLDPDRRISVEEALQHEYMREYAMPSDEPVAERPFDIFDDDEPKSVDEWKALIWREIERHNEMNANVQLAPPPSVPMS